MNQMAIVFEPRPAPRQAHSPTSRAAAIAAEPTAGTKRAMLLAFLRGRGAQGATDEEMQLEVPMAPNTQRPRRVELIEGRHIANSYRTRKTIGGLDAVVWIAKGLASA